MQLLNETQRQKYLDIWHRDNGISSSGLKIIACISMLISHIVQCNMLQKFNIYPTMTLTSSDWRVTVGALMLFIGRIAFPIFAFLIVNGMFLTRSVEKYIVRLFSFAIISEIPFDLAVSGQMFDFYNQNVFFTLALSASLIFVVEKIEKFDQSNLVKAILKIISVGIFCAIANYYHTDYSMLGILAVFFLCNRQLLPHRLLHAWNSRSVLVVFRIDFQKKHIHCDTVRIFLRSVHVFVRVFVDSYHSLLQRQKR